MKYFLIVLVAGMFTWGGSGKKSDAPAETKGSVSSAKPAVDDFTVIADQAEPDTLKGSLRVRLTVKPKIQDVNQERLQYQVIESAPGQGILRVRWEKVEVSLPSPVVL